MATSIMFAFLEIVLIRRDIGLSLGPTFFFANGFILAPAIFLVSVGGNHFVGPGAYKMISTIAIHHTSGKCGSLYQFQPI